jgi:hypothetical protein
MDRPYSMGTTEPKMVIFFFEGYAVGVLKEHSLKVTTPRQILCLYLARALSFSFYLFRLL